MDLWLIFIFLISSGQTEIVLEQTAEENGGTLKTKCRRRMEEIFQ